MNYTLLIGFFFFVITITCNYSVCIDVFYISQIVCLDIPLTIFSHPNSDHGELCPTAASSPSSCPAYNNTSCNSLYSYPIITLTNIE